MIVVLLGLIFFFVKLLIKWVGLLFDNDHPCNNKH